MLHSVINRVCVCLNTITLRICVNVFRIVRPSHINVDIRGEKVKFDGYSREARLGGAVMVALSI